MRHIFSLLSLWLLLVWPVNVHSAPTDGKLPIVRVEIATLSPVEKGLAVGTEIKQQFPDIERQYDTWLTEIFTQPHFNRIRHQHLPALLKTVDVPRKEEMQGITNAWQLTKDSHPGDGELSLEEYQILNLLPDLGLAPDGIGIGAFGKATADHHAIVGHNMEQRQGHKNTLQVVTIYEDEAMSFVTIGVAGLVSATHGFNQHSVFAALINAEPYSPYPLNHATTPKTSETISFSVRRVLESASSTHEAAKQLDNKQYAFAHSILLADIDGVQVQEYSPKRRESQSRYWDSALRQGLRWEHPQQLAVVDCLMLSTMPANCRDAKDSVRWHRLNALMQFTAQNPATPSDIGHILFDTANKRYEVFAEDTLQSLYFLPASNSLYLYNASTNTTPRTKPVHHAYPNLLPRIAPWKLKIQWLIWLLIILMLGAVIGVLHQKKTSKGRSKC